MTTKNLSLFVLILAIVALVFGVFFLRSHDATVEKAVIDTKALGQNIVVGINGTDLSDEEKRILGKIKPAGVILYARNISSIESTRDLIMEIKKTIDSQRELSVFIMIDEEPHGASRLSLYQNVVQGDIVQWNSVGKGAYTLASLGINVNLALLADFPFNKDTFIKDRIPVEDFEELIDFNDGFIKIQKDNGINSTLKHFPGAGLLKSDPHNIIDAFEVDNGDLEKSIMLFREGIKSGADFVMTNHALYKPIDDKNIATFSKAVVIDLLRNKLNFSGLIITDDLSDMVTSDKSTKNLVLSGVAALKAGHNLIMYSHDIKTTEHVFDEILIEMKTDDQLNNAIMQNYKKVKEFKTELIFRH